MQTYFIRFQRLQDDETGFPVLVVKGPRGKAMAVGSGPTIAEAEAQLRGLVQESLAGIAEEPRDPMSILSCGVPPKDSLVLTSKDLFPILLRYHRLRSGLTQEQMAQRLNISQPTYSGYERWDANPYLSTVEAIGNALGIRVVMLFPDVA